MPLSHRQRHRHRRSGIGRVWTAEVLDVDGRGRISPWSILEDSFWGSSGRRAIKKMHITSYERERTSVSNKTIAGCVGCQTILASESWDAPRGRATTLTGLRFSPRLNTC